MGVMSKMKHASTMILLYRSFCVPFMLREHFEYPENVLKNTEHEKNFEKKYTSISFLTSIFLIILPATTRPEKMLSHYYCHVCKCLPVTLIQLPTHCGITISPLQEGKFHLQSMQGM